MRIIGRAPPRRPPPALLFTQARSDRFVGMYVNNLTLDYGERGREAVRAA